MAGTYYNFSGTSCSTSTLTQLTTDATNSAPVLGEVYSGYTSGDFYTVTNSGTTSATPIGIDVDTNNNFASSLFTPTVAGYYQINVKVYNAGTALRNYYFSNRLYKNGSRISQSAIAIYQLGSAAEFCVDQSRVVYMNGSTDYLEVYSYNIDYTSAASTIVYGGSTYISFNGSLVRAA
jgi:hypothetical protein